jgi:uncharacterized repeat protein (TIGR01451 family)
MFSIISQQVERSRSLIFHTITSGSHLTGFASLLLLGLFSSPVAAQNVLVEEPFQTNTTSRWQVGVANPANVEALPCLTARSPDDQSPTDIGACPNGPLDPIGSGVLRLTNREEDQAGFVFFQEAIPSSKGLVVLFDFFSYGGTGADGLSFFLIDGNASPNEAGAFGGSLGYAFCLESSGNCERDIPGLVGGYVGIGFDEFGNFSNPNDNGKIGGPGQIPDSVALRGAGSGLTGYQYLTGTDPNELPTLDFPNVTTRPETTPRRVRLTLTPNNRISLEINFFDGRGFVPVLEEYDLNTAPGQPPFPSSFKFGFAASTGGQTNIHEIRAFRITTIEPNLRLVKRITSVTRGGALLSGVNFNEGQDNPNDPEDTAAGWSQLPPNERSPSGIPRGIVNLDNTAVNSGDEVEYTVYFLSDGGADATAVNVCDLIPAGTTFIRDSFAPQQGIVLNRAGTTTTLTNALDNDSGRFVPPLNPLPSSSACSDPSNPNGAVLVNLGEVSSDPGDNYGFIRFRVRVN